MTNRDRLPEWDGQPATWAEYLKATRWYFNGLKKEERPMAAARLASKLMQSENVSTKRLIMKPRPGRVQEGD